MICQICKDRVATIRLREIINDVLTEMHLCEHCFQAREQEGATIAPLADGKALDALAGQSKKKSAVRVEPVTCHACGTTDEELNTKGRLGCESCYKTFAASLDPILKRVHGSTEHRGKVPHHVARNLDLKTELRRLQEDLQSAILSENYERAAKLRDKIKQFEKI